MSLASPEQGAYLQQENALHVMRTVAALENAALDRYVPNGGEEPPMSGQELTARRVGANMLDSMMIHTVSRALHRNAPDSVDENLLEKTRSLVDLYKDRSPRSEAEAKNIAEQIARLPRFSFEQMMLIRESLIEMWAHGEDDFQPMAQYVLVNSLFPGESSADHVLHQVENGHTNHVETSGTDTPAPEKVVLPLGRPELPARKVAGAFGYAGSSLLRRVQAGGHEIGVFVSEPTHGSHHKQAQGEMQIELVPFRIEENGQRIPQFDHKVPLPPGMQLLLEPLTGAKDGASIGYDGEHGSVIVSPGTNGSVKVLEPTPELVVAGR
jgi:hypothetical protein